jgi:hypothetical protein
MDLKWSELTGYANKDDWDKVKLLGFFSASTKRSSGFDLVSISNLDRKCKGL